MKEENEVNEFFRWACLDKTLKVSFESYGSGRKFLISTEKENFNFKRLNGTELLNVNFFEKEIEIFLPEKDFQIANKIWRKSTTNDILF